MPPGLHLDYGPDFLTQMVDNIALTLTSPLLSALISNIRELQSPGIPGKPAPFKVDEGLWGHGRAPAKPGTPGPSHNGGIVPKVQTGEGEAPENRPPDQGECDEDQPLPDPDPEEVAGVVISDDEDIDLTIKVSQAASTPISEPVLSQKRPLEDRSPRSSPPKKWATEEEERSTPPWEAALPRGVTEEGILSKRYETFAADNGWVQHVRCSLLGLEAGTMPSREDIDTSEHFVPKVAASESDLPEVITNHWLPILQEEGLLVECFPDQFTAMVDCVPLYTQEGLERYLPTALSSFASTGAPRLTAVVPLECCVGTDKEFLLSNFHWHGCLMRQSFTIGGRCRQLATALSSFVSTGAPQLTAIVPLECCVGTDKEFLLLNFHWHGCLMRQSFTIGGRCRQLAFCPYCGVINENSDTALSHVRKRLDLHFVCGGCYSKSFLNGPALHRHLRTQCPSVMTIRDQFRTSRR